MKKVCALLALSLLSGISAADVPGDNTYQVRKRYYAPEPKEQQFTVSAHDSAYVIQPNIDTYTYFHPGNAQALYTIHAYPDAPALPKIGEWMTIKLIKGMPSYQYPPGSPELKNPATKLVPAHWISLTSPAGQYILEPINYVFVVYAQDAKLASAKLHQVMQKIGFGGTASPDHSGGYSALIGDQEQKQLANDQGLGYTYSNNDFRYQNDHFRIFGAYAAKIKGKDAFLFSASVSEESGYESSLAKLPPEQIHAKLDEMQKQNPNILFYENTGHHFVSFGNARNNLALALIQAGYSTYYASLGNVVHNLGESTEDHDGKVYITAINS